MVQQWSACLVCSSGSPILQAEKKKEGKEIRKGVGNSFRLRVVKGTVEADGMSNGSPRYAGDLEKDGSGWPWADQGS